VFAAIILATLQFARDGLWPRVAGALLKPKSPRQVADAAPLLRRTEAEPAQGPLLALVRSLKSSAG
jgi:hypothetical protein